MDNHVNISIKENEEIKASVRCITIGCIRWHNQNFIKASPKRVKNHYP